MTTSLFGPRDKAGKFSFAQFQHRVVIYFVVPPPTQTRGYRNIVRIDITGHLANLIEHI